MNIIYVYQKSSFGSVVYWYSIVPKVLGSIPTVNHNPNTFPLHYGLKNW